jgi:hypothetical protein
MWLQACSVPGCTDKCLVATALADLVWVTLTDRSYSSDSWQLCPALTKLVNIVSTTIDSAETSGGAATPPTSTPARQLLHRSSASATAMSVAKHALVGLSQEEQHTICQQLLGHQASAEVHSNPRRLLETGNEEVFEVPELVRFAALALCCGSAAASSAIVPFFHTIL